MTKPSESFALRDSSGGQLTLIRSGESIPVTPKLCFPWSHPQSFISLRQSLESGDEEENKNAFREVALVESLDDLDSESRAVLARHLAAAGFLLEVTRVIKFKKEFELRVWEVETKQGPRKFQTKLDHFPTVLPDGGFLIKDVAGDLIHIPNPDTLDAKSQQKLYAFSD